MPQIANQDYIRVLNDGKTNVEYPLIRALNRGTIFDVIFEIGATRKMRVTEVDFNPGIGTEIYFGRGATVDRIMLYYSEETYATIYSISEQFGAPVTNFFPDDDNFLMIEQEYYIACNGFLVKITANDDDKIITIEISDTPVGDRTHADVTPEQLQTLVGVTLY